MKLDEVRFGGLLFISKIRSENGYHWINQGNKVYLNAKSNGVKG
jgi:hypothetical protein